MTTLFSPDIEGEAKELPFICITARDQVDLELKVNELLKQGYQPVGSPFTFGKYILMSLVKPQDQKVRYTV